MYTKTITHFRIFKAGMKLDIFYNLLVKEPEPGKESAIAIDIEDKKDVIEVSHRFRHSKNFFFSYATRSILEFIIAALVLVWMGIFGFPVIAKVRATISSGILLPYD